MSSAFAVILCASLVAVDGDTIRCNGESMRLLGDGKPFVSGIDTPELAGKCRAERMLARLAKERLGELRWKFGEGRQDSDAASSGAGAVA